MADVPETAVAAVRRYWDDKIPAALRNELRVEYTVRGKSITIYECRPPWDATADDEWTRQPVAQLRYDPTDHNWHLYCADRNSRSHPLRTGARDRPARRAPRRDRPRPNGDLLGLTQRAGEATGRTRTQPQLGHDADHGHAHGRCR